MEQSQNPMKIDPSDTAARPGDDAREPVPDTDRTAESGAADGAGAAEIEERVVRALKTVYDPEIPVDIYELGLIYDIAVSPADAAGEHAVHVKMTLTSPACPVAGSLPGEVEQKVAGVPGVERAEVELVWDPGWNPSMMSEAARLELGFF